MAFWINLYVTQLIIRALKLIIIYNGLEVCGTRTGDSWKVSPEPYQLSYTSYGTSFDNPGFGLQYYAI